MNRILKMLRQAPQVVKRFCYIHPRDKVETTSRVLSGLLLAGAVFGGGVVLLQAAPAHAEREIAQAPVAPQVKAKPVRPNSVAATASSPRRVWVDPPPLTSHQQTAEAAARPAPEPAPLAQAAPVAQAASAAAQPVPTDCLPAGLQNVLKDVGTRFGAVTLVSTKELHTDNHSRGSVRHKLHSACKAVDFKVKGNRQAVIAYLRSRSEVAGVNSYDNNEVIHIDYNEPRQMAQR